MRIALRRIWIVLLGGAVLALVSAGLTPSVAAAPTCIYVVQGLPDLTVSVAVDGETVVDSLAGGKVAGPILVKRGTRTVTVTDGEETVATSRVKLAAGSNSEIVVHLPASPTGDPVITRFDNNLDAVQTGRAAHSVAHVAAAGPIDIRVNEEVVTANVANGEYTYKVVPAGTRSVDIVQSGRSEPLLGPLDMTLKPDKMTWVFVVGVPGEDLTLVRHMLDLEKARASKRPADIRTGTGGQAAELAARR